MWDRDGTKQVMCAHSQLLCGRSLVHLQSWEVLVIWNRDVSKQVMCVHSQVLWLLILGHIESGKMSAEDGQISALSCRAQDW